MTINSNNFAERDWIEETQKSKGNGLEWFRAGEKGNQSLCDI